MKCRVKATELKRLLKVVTSIYDYARESAGTQSIGVLSVEEDGLWIEYGSAGAYLRKRAEATVLRPGIVGIDLKSLQKLRLSGDVTLNATKGSAKLSVHVGKSSKYDIPKDQDAEELVSTYRPGDSSKKPSVKIATHLLRLAASSVIYKSGEENTKIRLQLAFQKARKKSKGLFVLSANDSYSFARYTTENSAVRVSKNLRFIITSSLLQEVMKEVDSEEPISIWDIEGSDEDTAVVRFVSDGFDFCHPVIAGEEFEDIDEIAAEATNSKRVAYFVTTQKAMKEAYDAVTVFNTSAEPVIINFIIVRKGGVTAIVKKDSNKAESGVETEKVRCLAKKGTTLPVNSNYLGEFIKSFPKSLPMRVEKWEDTLRIEAENFEEGLIEYVVAQEDSDD